MYTCINIQFSLIEDFKPIPKPICPLSNLALLHLVLLNPGNDLKWR